MLIRCSWRTPIKPPKLTFGNKCFTNFHVLYFVIYKSKTPMHSLSKSAVLEELSEELVEVVVCHCSNVCNRASGRGCCPCLAKGRQCSGLCRCGTAKMFCKNKPAGLENTHTDENDAEEDSVEDIPVRGTRDLDVLSDKSLKEDKKRGQKRKHNGSPSSKLAGTRSEYYYKKEWEQMPEVGQWLTRSKTSRHAYCIFCECELKLDQYSSFLFKHSRSQKHVKSTKLWKDRPQYDENTGQAFTETKKRVLEDIREFQPWLRLHSITGYAYCLYCKAEIKDGESLDVLRRHKKLKNHIKIASKKPEVTSENEEEVRTSTGQRRQRQRKNVVGVIPSSDSEESSGDDDDDDGDNDDLQAERRSNHLSTGVICQQVTESEAKILSFMVENDVPLYLTESLVSMLKGLSSGGVGLQRLLMDNEKAANMVRQSNDSFLNEILVERLKKTLFYILIDLKTETPDKNHVGIFVVFCNSDLSIQVELLDVKDCGEGTAENIYNRLTESLKQKEKEGVPLSNWMGFLCDTSSVPFHTMFSVMAMVAEEYPWVSPLVCPSRIAELSAITACKSLPEKLEQFCHLIHEHFQSGPKQAVSFLDYQEFCNEKNHDILNAKDVPWLAMYDFLVKLLEQWHPLKTYFNCLMMTETDEKYRLILETFSNPLVKVLLLALKFTVGIIKTYNSNVLTGEPLFPTLDEETNELLRTFANFFMKNDIVMTTEDLTKLCVTDGETYLPLPQIYLGLDASNALSSYMEENQLSFEDPNVVDILQVIRGFYREFITHLQVSLQMSHPSRSMASFIDPQNAVNVEAPISGDMFASFSHSNLIDVKQVQGEWRSVCNIGLPSSDMLQSPLEYWKHVLNQKTEDLENLQRVILYFFSLPVLRFSEEEIFKFVKDWNLEAWRSLKSADMWTYRNAQSKLRNMLRLNGQTDEGILKEDGVIELPLY